MNSRTGKYSASIESGLAPLLRYWQIGWCPRADSNCYG
jgi:hypothetical protein